MKQTMNNATLRAQALGKNFVQGSLPLEVLKNLSVDFHQTSSYAITGASGAGKSTLLHILAGLEQPTYGNVFFNDHNLAKMSDLQRTSFCNKSIGLVFQLPYLINELSVVENVMIKGLIAGNQLDECRHKAYALLASIGLQDKANTIPSKLSGGQQQRVAIMRALFNEPTFLLADEPTGNLDEKSGNALIDFLLECHQIYKMGLIISSHDAYVTHKMHTVLELHDRMLRHSPIT
jgi:ABC-type lipoprotein export system ATPase subunit